ncbi:MAG: hypothetical protein RIC87_11910 [Kiloniellales bacterium]
MTVFFHIGSTKTGTTSLQRFLAVNRQILRKQGYRFPQFLGRENHTKLAVYAHDLRQHEAALRLGVNSPDSLAAFRETLEADLHTRLRGETDHVVLSSEHCSAILNSPHEIARLKSLLTRIGSDIKIIFYARQQAEFLVSQYSTNVVKGFTQRLQYPGQDNLIRNFNYFALLSRWEDVFGKDAIIGRIFDPKKMVNGDVIHDFCDVIGIRRAFLRRAEIPERLNESLDYETAEFLRKFNALVPSRADNAINPDRSNIGDIVRHLSTKEKIALPPSFAERLRKDLYESNCLFRERFVDGIKEDPFDWSERGTRKPLQDLTIDDAYRIFAEIWKLKVQQTIKTRHR